MNNRLKQRCFPVKFGEFLRTPILKNICERLLLEENKLFQNTEKHRGVEKIVRRNRSMNIFLGFNLARKSLISQLKWRIFAVNSKHCKIHLGSCVYQGRG